MKENNNYPRFVTLRQQKIEVEANKESKSNKLEMRPWISIWKVKILNQ